MARTTVASEDLYLSKMQYFLSSPEEVEIFSSLQQTKEL